MHSMRSGSAAILLIATLALTASVQAQQTPPPQPQPPPQPMSFFVTSVGLAGNAMVGHHDRLGGPNSSWNAVHLSNGCSQQNLVSTGGAGLLYCFAAN